MRLASPSGSKSVIGPTPLSPANNDFQNASMPVPLGARTPIPVMTTRFFLCMANLGQSNNLAAYKSGLYALEVCLYIPELKCCSQGCSPVSLDALRFFARWVYLTVEKLPQHPKTA